MVMEGGSWIIAWKPLLLRPWTVELELKKLNIHKIPVWVSFPNLPFQFWSTGAISIIGSVIGKPLFTDKYTTRKERLLYTQMCIEVDAKECRKNHAIVATEDGKSFVHPVTYD